jgi:hypothetical protein
MSAACVNGPCSGKRCHYATSPCHSSPGHGGPARIGDPAAITARSVGPDAGILDGQGARVEDPADVDSSVAAGHGDGPDGDRARGHAHHRATAADHGNDPPASPHYTEARLSPAGRIALAAERGQIAPVPVGLINGSTHRQGTRPPFRPAAVIDAIRQVLARPRLPARQITAVAGPPDFITGCAVTGDLAALAAGQRTDSGSRPGSPSPTPPMSAPGWPRRPAPDMTRQVSRRTPAARSSTPAARSSSWTTSRRPSAPDDIMVSICKRGQEYAWHTRHPELGALTGLPIKDLVDLTARGGIRTYQHEDLHASLTALQNALASRQQKRLTAYDRPPDRDTRVRAAVAAGLSKHRVHRLTGIGRSTIDRILAATTPAGAVNGPVNGPSGGADDH